jgi:hypothetical protein
MSFSDTKKHYVPFFYITTHSFARVPNLGIRRLYLREYFVQSSIFAITTWGSVLGHGIHRSKSQPALSSLATLPSWHYLGSMIWLVEEATNGRWSFLGQGTHATSRRKCKMMIE